MGSLSWGLSISLWLLLGSLSFSAQANSTQRGMEGITLHNTRVIYPSTATNGVNYQLTNNTSVPYLLQARIQPWAPTEGIVTAAPQLNPNDSRQAFIALPPLQRIAPGETVTLLLRLKQADLPPQDNESIALLALTAIPAEKSENISTTTQMVIAVQNNVKLFYRPATLPQFDEDTINEQLQFVPTSTGITVKNPSAFYITFDRLTVGSHKVDLGSTRMVAPRSEQHWPMTLDNRPKNIEWQVINDKGGVSDKIHQKQLPDS
jgi:P pilus assembly chaperone PapD